MSLLFKNVADLCDAISIMAYCQDDSTLLILQSQGSQEHWIPTFVLKPNEDAANKITEISLSIFGIVIPIKCLIYVSKIWVPSHDRKDLVHLVFEVSVSRDIKKKTKITLLKYKQKFRWVPKRELVQLHEKNYLKSPELIQWFDLVLKTKSPDFSPTSYNNLPNFVEIDDKIIVIGKEQLDQLVHEAGIDRNTQEILYRQFIFHCYPALYMSLDTFIPFFEELGWEQFRLTQIFYAADLNGDNALSFHEVLYFVAATEPGISYTGAAAEQRCRYLFKFLDREKKLFLDKDDMVYLFTMSKGGRSRSVDFVNVEKEVKDWYKSVNMNENQGLTMTDFVSLVGCLKIRGTSGIFRAERSVKVYTQKYVNKDSKQKNPLEIYQPSTTTSYEIALHLVAISSTGFTTDQQIPFRRQVSSIGLNPEKSLDSFTTEDSIAQNLIKTIRFLANENSQILTYSPIDQLKYNWKNIDPSYVVQHIRQICNKVLELFMQEPRLVQVSVPVYVLGDLHGNISDLLSFEKVFWKLGAELCPCNLLFLGDFVDRGVFSLEVTLYLFAQKILAPAKIKLLRGNHEIKRIQQNWTFETECRKKFGDKLGPQVFESINKVFDVLPLAAIIDKKIFCCHGGIPPPWLCPTTQAINSIPVLLDNPQVQSALAWDLMWNDPIQDKVSDTVAMEMSANEGFAANERRCTGHIFGKEAVKRFLNKNGFTHVIRAHQVAEAGFSIRQKGTVITVFSTSKYCNGRNEAACILVDRKKLRVFRLKGDSKN